LADKLDSNSIQAGLKSLAGWSLDADKLHRQFRFKNFVEAFGFMTSAAIEAEKMNHHPEWFNVYNKVDVHLITHEVGGITELDFALAERMNQLADSR
jgi:4a-hydroxytetrahydrobiopterin dehydratase